MNQDSGGTLSKAGDDIFEACEGEACEGQAFESSTGFGGAPSFSGPSPAEARRQDTEIHVVIGLERPFKILQASPEWLTEFDFSSDEAVGRTLGLIQGPMTERPSILSLFEGARWGKPAEAAIIFYSRHGQGTLYNVRARCPTALAGREPTALMMSFIRCSTISWKEATAEDDLAKALVEVTAPCRTVQVSAEFADLYNMLQHELLGRTLNIIQGPSTDRSKWAALLHDGQRGLSSRAVISTSTRDCREFRTEISVYPVIGSNGSFLHLLLIFSAMDELPPSPAGLHPSRGKAQVRGRPFSHNWDGRQLTYNQPIYNHELHRDFEDGYPRSQTHEIEGVMASMVGRSPHRPGVDASQMSMPSGRRMHFPQHTHVPMHDYLLVGQTRHHEYEARALGLEQSQRQPHALRHPHADLAEFDIANLLPRRLRADAHFPAARPGMSSFDDASKRSAGMPDPPGVNYPMHDPREDPAHLQDLEIGHPSVPVDIYPESDARDLVHVGLGQSLSPALHSQLMAATHRDIRPMQHADVVRPVALAANAEPQMASLVHMGYGSEIGAAPQQQKEDVVSTVIPRRKKKEGSIGMPVRNSVKPVKIALDLLERLSCLSLSQAADTLGISSTAMKKSCRKLGVTRWPYKSDQPIGGKCHIDDAYVRKIQRKYAVSLKKGVASPAAGAAGGSSQQGEQMEAGSTPQAETEQTERIEEFGDD